MLMAFGAPTLASMSNATASTEPAAEPEPSTNPFVNLLRSRKFLLALFAIAAWVAGLFKYDLDPTLTMGAISAVLSILIYSIAKEDAAAKHASMAADADLERADGGNAALAGVITRLMPALLSSLGATGDQGEIDNKVGMRDKYDFTLDMTDEEIDEEIERAHERFEKHLQSQVTSLKEARAAFNATVKKSTDTEH